jgi:hypothetical protein
MVNFTRTPLDRFHTSAGPAKIANGITTFCNELSDLLAHSFTHDLLPKEKTAGKSIDFLRKIVDSNQTFRTFQVTAYVNTNMNAYRC